MKIFFHFKVCRNVLENGWKIEHIPKEGSYAYKGDQWAAFNDVIDLEVKAKWIYKNGFGGALVFVLDYDDWTNECNCEQYPLLKSINRQFNLLDDKDSAPNCSLLNINSVSVRKVGPKRYKEGCPIDSLEYPSKKWLNP